MPAAEFTLLNGLATVLFAQGSGIPDGYFDERQESFGYPNIRFNRVRIKNDTKTYTTQGETNPLFSGPLWQTGTFDVIITAEGMSEVEALGTRVMKILTPTALIGFCGAGDPNPQGREPALLRQGQDIDEMPDRSPLNKVIAQMTIHYLITGIGYSY